LRGSGGEDALQISEGKLEATTAQGRPRRMWLGDIKQWTQLNIPMKTIKDWLKAVASTVVEHWGDEERD